ncbi:adenylate kinase [Candidatus Nanohalococcus occultus]|uniref:Adenylate kinase n=1 Tax=Candidatus Nanohalococcus occultus TaxID=2978047 RepID=A0ABY8CES4_9ARCH|nr:Archaeal adenylate kinase [Candidatus Nanohaloarchaeota archaeon SVXNc]
MGEVNIVTGLSGVGKGTVLEEAMLLADKDYELINYGDRMLEIAKERELVESRDEMKKIGTETYREIQKEAAESIFEDAEEKDVIVDTHAAIYTPHGYIPGLPKWSIEKLEPSKIIMIDADSEAIWNRVKDDEGRSREHESIEHITEYRRIAREMAASGCVLTGAYLKVLENADGQAEKAAEELVKTLRA